MIALSKPPIAQHPNPGATAPKNRGHRIGMAVGDLLFLALVGAATMVAMHLAHMIRWEGWGFIVEMAIGMVAAMLGQAILAWLAAALKKSRILHCTSFTREA